MKDWLFFMPIAHSVEVGSIAQKNGTHLVSVPCGRLETKKLSLGKFQ